jgi:hypothetical protein
MQTSANDIVTPTQMSEFRTLRLTPKCKHFWRY